MCVLCIHKFIPKYYVVPECVSESDSVSGEELSVVRSIEGEQVPLFGYCTVDKVN